MKLVPNGFKHKKVKHAAHFFATGAGATVLVSNMGTGLAVVPVYMAWTASAAGSFTLVKGSGGSTYLQAAFGAGEVRNTDWYDDGSDETIGANTALEIVKAAGVGAGSFHVWYVVTRQGAGNGGTAL